MKLKLGMDVDGVVAGFTEWVLASLGIDAKEYAEQKPDSCERKAARAWIDAAIERPETWVQLPVLPGATAAVARLIDAGVNPVFISQFPQRFYDLRMWWLRYVLEVPMPRLVARPAYRKAEYASGERLTHFVEDRPDTAQAMAEAGIDSTLVPSEIYTADTILHPAIHLRTLDQWVDAVLAERGP